jgi:Mrp family chromosome partitioning ATPase
MTPLPNSSRGTIITITSGKGGVGKTSVVINLALSLARLGIALASSTPTSALATWIVLLGMTPQHHLGDYLIGEKTLDEITIPGRWASASSRRAAVCGRSRRSAATSGRSCRP